MACAPCAAAAAAAYAKVKSASSSNTVPAESNYTVSQLQIWLTKLNCIKLQNKYFMYNTNPTTINSYLGIVASAIRNAEYIVNFENELNKINSFIIFVISKNDC
jgi:hypothetical protein